jgi:mannose-P-dolichol utilization defect protein 1
VMGGAIIKLPQIIKIIQRKNVEGISFVAVVFEVNNSLT